MDFVVDPTAGLLHTERAPFFFVEQATARHVPIDGFGEKHVAILVLIVLILL